MRGEILMSQKKAFVILFSITWIVGCFIAFLIIMNAFEANAKKAADAAAKAAYTQGYRDALYKRPASDDLELVCAGLWLSQLKPGEQ